MCPRNEGKTRGLVVTIKYAAKRDGYWIYRRRVPEEFSDVDTRTFVKVSTKIRIADDPACLTAGDRIKDLNRETEIYWTTLASGRVDEGIKRYQAALRRARQRGFAYIPADDVVNPDKTPLESFVSRADAISLESPAEMAADSEAMLGGAEGPQLMISGLPAAYEENQATALLAMADDQKRKWRNPKKRAVANLLKVIDDKPVVDLTRADAVEFRVWWRDRVIVEGVKADTANKDFGHINKMLRELILEHQLPMVSPFRDLRFQSDGEGTRYSYEPAFVRDRILAEGALDGLNKEARAIVYLIEGTGLRLSEACNPVFVLDHAVPHVSVQALDRKTKTLQSIREVPLVGAALKAAKAFPEGFPRYRHKADSLSKLVNKYFDHHGLRPTRDHTLYSLRHCFEDRLTAVEAPEKVMAALMGHKFYRPRYGSGPTLELKAKWLGKIAFSPPSRI